MGYRISTVAEMTGIPRNTLIAWERRYGLLSPERLENGYRRYTEADVAQLFKLKNALNAGLKISEAVDLVRAGLRAPPASPVETHEPESPLRADKRDGSFSQVRERLFVALSTYRSDEAQNLLGTLLTIPFPTRLHQIYFPLLQQIGDAWQTGAISVAQEHFATGIVKAHLATIFISTGQVSLSAPHAATTTLPHEEHEIAALAMAIQLSLGGYRVSYLGPKLPARDLVEFCKSQNPKLVCISCITLPTEKEFEQYLSTLPAVAKAGTRVVLGGQALSGRKAPSPLEFCPSWEEFRP